MKKSKLLLVALIGLLLVIGLFFWSCGNSGNCPFGNDYCKITAKEASMCTNEGCNVSQQWKKNLANGKDVHVSKCHCK